MKTAILNFSLGPTRAGGGETWIKELMREWEGEVEHVRWGPPRADGRETILRDSPYRVLRGSNKQRIQQLREYDFIIVSNIYTTASRMVECYETFTAARVPWTMMIHGAHEGVHPSVKHVPHLLDSPAFSGVVLTTAQAFVLPFEAQRGTLFDIVELPYLPYRRQFGERVPPNGGVVSTGVLMRMKGIEAMIRGMEGSGHGLVFRGMIEQAFKRRQDHDVLRKISRDIGADWADDLMSSEGGWEVEFPTGEVIRYNGPYMEVAEAMSEGGVHINLTSTTFCSHHLEYATLEAMDYGLDVIVPQAQLREQSPYCVNAVDYQTPRRWNVLDVKEKISDALSWPQYIREDIASCNREALVEHHDPKRYVVQVQRALGLS